jgi:hypothetical protein
MTRSAMTIGTSEAGQLAIDLPKLLETRMLVQSNSGGGKSWALRRLLEQTAPAAQQIIIDVEGEFTTLREKFDYVICAPQDADAAATPQTAAVLARKLRELRVSAVLNIYELKSHERQAFVQRFFDALMQTPRDHWNPALIVLDEAHLFAPEQGKAESTAAVIDLATRGRKRGLSLVAATQRLSKLHKDVAAELLNKLIGRTGLDVDVRRAADELGLAGREAMTTLRELNPGEFFAFGPALTRSVVKVTIGAVETTHPRVGDRLSIKTPAPSHKVLSLLRELGDIPREAEAEAVTLEQLDAENTSLKRQLAAQKSAHQGASEAEVKTRIAKAIEEETLKHQETLRAIAALAGVHPPSGVQPASHSGHGPPAADRPAFKAPAQPLPPKPAHPPKVAMDGITQPQQRVLDAMATLKTLGLDQLHKTQVAAVAGVSPNSGSYANNLGRLRTLGMIDYPQASYVAFTAKGEGAARFPSTAPTLDDLHQAWLGIVTNPQQRILREVLACYPQPMAKAELAAKIQVSPDSGSYANNLGRLRTLGAIEYPRPGFVRAAEVLFPAGAA